MGSGSVVIERVVANLYVFATRSEERRVVPGGTYELRRAGIEERGVEAGAIAWCR